MNLKTQLRLFLQSRGLSASELARMADVPKQSISDWLGGTLPRDIQKLKRVADVLRTSVDHLVFGDGISHAPQPNTNPKVDDPEWVKVEFEGRFEGQFKGLMRKISGAGRAPGGRQ